MVAQNLAPSQGRDHRAYFGGARPCATQAEHARCVALKDGRVGQIYVKAVALHPVGTDDKILQVSPSHDRTVLEERRRDESLVRREHIAPLRQTCLANRPAVPDLVSAALTTNSSEDGSRWTKPSGAVVATNTVAQLFKVDAPGDGHDFEDIV